MVSIRRRTRKKRDVWVVDYRDGAGIRRLETYRTKDDAQNAAAQRTLESGQAAVASTLDRNITIADYTQHWQQALIASVKPATYEVYEKMLRLHVVPALGPMRVRQVQQARIRALIADKLASGLSVNTVRLIAATLGTMLSSAGDDGLLRTNPIAGLRRKLRVLRNRDGGASERVKAMTGEQLATFLETARTRLPAFYPLALLLARSGLRLGEALGLRWTDIDLAGRAIRVERTLGRHVKGFPITGPAIGTPKSGRARTVDMSQALARALTALLRERREQALRRGQGQAAPAWVFLTETGRPLRQGEVREDFGRVLRWAGLPAHFTPHALRHSFAVALIQRNAPLPYVQAQLGHASISQTVDVYARWLPSGNRTLIDQLDVEPAARETAEQREAVAGGRGDQNATISTEPEIPSPEVIAFIGTSAAPLSLNPVTQF